MFTFTGHMMRVGFCFWFVFFSAYDLVLLLLFVMGSDYFLNLMWTSCFGSFFFVTMANLQPDVLFGKYLAYFLKAICILGGDLSSDIDAVSQQILNIHGAIFPISWIAIHAVTKSKRIEIQMN